MPVHANNGKLIQFVYNPSYLKNQQHTFSDVNVILRNLKIPLIIEEMLENEFLESAERSTTTRIILTIMIKASKKSHLSLK